MATFTTEIYIYTPDGEEHEIHVTVDYDAAHDPGRISGPPENCYPPESEMTINSITGDFPAGVTMEMASAYQLEKIEEEAWEHYFSKGVDDED